MSIFSKRLRDLREEKGISMMTLARKIEVSDAAICKWENDFSEPKISYIKKLADFFEVSTDYLLGLENDFGAKKYFPPQVITQEFTFEEQEIISLIRKNPPYNVAEWVKLYSNLPVYMQQSIFAELKGMHLGYLAAKAKSKKGQS